MSLTPPRDLEGSPTRAALLVAARERFADTGFHATRLVDVAAGAGLTTGAFYRYFASKADAFHVLFDDYVEDLSTSLAEAESLADYALRWLTVSEAHRGTVAASEENTREDPAFRAHRERCRQAWSAVAMAYLPSGLEASVRRVSARLVVDSLDYYWLTAARGWSKVDSDVVASSFATLITSGIYVNEGHAPPPDRHPPMPATSGRARTRRWRWQVAPDRAEPTSKRGKTQRDAILQAATDVYAADGYKNATIGQIAQRASVSSATVYRYFTDKSDIFFCLLGRLEDVLYEQAMFPLGPEGRLVVYPAALRYLEARRKYAAVYRVWRELAWTRGEMEEAWVSLRREFQGPLARVIARGRGAGIVHEDLNPQAVAEIVVAAFDGLSHTRYDLGWDTETSDEALASVLSALLGSGIGAASAR